MTHEHKRESVMILLSPSTHKRNGYVVAILLIVCSVFTADILDLREELRILSCPYSSLDNNITTAIAASTDFETEPLPILRAVDRMSSVKISFLHLLPYGFRAPPVWL
jgi:hypothetical protein